QFFVPVAPDSFKTEFERHRLVAGILHLQQQHGAGTRCQAAAQDRVIVERLLRLQATHGQPPETERRIRASRSAEANWASSSEDSSTQASSHGQCRSPEAARGRRGCARACLGDRFLRGSRAKRGAKTRSEKSSVAAVTGTTGSSAVTTADASGCGR